MAIGKKIVFVVLGGAGYMGMNGLRTLKELNKALRQEVFDVEHLLVADIDCSKPEPERKSEWREMENIFGVRPHAVASVEYVRPYIWGLRVADRHCPVIVYDATPNSFHNGQLTQLAVDRDPQIFYLGEKPIFTDISDVENAKTLLAECEFFCELIETENPVFRIVLAYLQRQRL